MTINDVEEAIARAAQDWIERTACGWRDYSLPAGVLSGVPIWYSAATRLRSLLAAKG